jgi:hypothetical protein
MSDHRDVLDQADKLMRRHRVFVAGAPAATAAAEVAESVDDLPVLTDMVAPEHGSPVAPSVAAVATTSVDEMVEVLAHELMLERLVAQQRAVTSELTTWLDKSLPMIIMSVLDGVTDQLVAEVTAEMRTVLLQKLQLAVEAESESQPSRDASD